MINSAGKPSKKANLSYTWLKPVVLDNRLTPAGYDEWGRLAFLDALAYSYPGFIITGDEVRLLERTASSATGAVRCSSRLYTVPRERRCAGALSRCEEF